MIRLYLIYGVFCVSMAVAVGFTTSYLLKTYGIFTESN